MQMGTYLFGKVRADRVSWDAAIDNLRKVFAQKSSAHSRTWRKALWIN
jgi:hypothetical protein